MKTEHLKAIAEHDGNIALLRKSWLAAKPEEKGRWMALINQALDERLRLMAMRDGKPQLLDFGISDERAWEVGLACGGKLKVFVEKLG
jgi:xanthine/CO dehydrogenase XdhC/CoxF family maturation factor